MMPQTGYVAVNYIVHNYDAYKCVYYILYFREAFQNEHLIIALEPEVASLYCRHFPQSLTIYGTRSFTDVLENGSKYLVLDIGGGTVDVTAHEIQSDGTLKELYQASGGSWGGTTVDNEFKKLLITIFGSEVIAETTTDYPSEMKKNNASIEETIVTTPIGDKIKFLRDKLIINSEKFESLFDNAVNKLVIHLRKLLHLDQLMDITTILLVGGFSDSIIIKNSILSNFPNIRIINPEDCSLAVLKGAVLYGHNPKIIKSRICKSSYGIGIHVKFEEGVHPEERKRTICGSDICDDVFDIHLNLGERVEINTPRLEKVYHAQNNPAKIAYLDVYASTSESPMFVTDESCNKIGYVILELSGDKETNESTEGTETNIEGTETKIYVSFHYIGSELGAIVREASTDKILRAKFDFMG
ncbi:unnamed protein product [Mytilus edulis]|uniref:Uncharacterized protein n=1 Tax=Mytilus edulis TaxID=6550 RepID=A0A8S3SU79_MYTED|nr:unnamed protein product [Mytilus edulis]